jgi:transposase
LEKYPITARCLERFFHVHGDEFERQYKDFLSGYRSWDQLSHAGEWLLFPENIGPSLSIDETSLSNGELYTILTNREKHGGQGSIVAVVAGTKSEDVITVLEKIPEEELHKVREVTLDLSESMRKIVRRCFPKADRVIDRFHVQKLAFEATQEIRIKHRWEALQQETDLKENAKLLKEKYEPERFENGDTRKELLARSRYLLFKSGEKWTDKQRERAKIVFEQYPDIKKAYSLSHSLRLIFNKRSTKESARLNMARWYNKVEEAGLHSFNVIAATFYEHSEDILNFYINRSTNASAESFNAKIKFFRAELRGVLDIPFFLFRLSKLYA